MCEGGRVCVCVSACVRVRVAVSVCVCVSACDGVGKGAFGRVQRLPAYRWTEALGGVLVRSHIQLYQGLYRFILFP